MFARCALPPRSLPHAVFSALGSAEPEWAIGARCSQRTVAQGWRGLTAVAWAGMQNSQFPLCLQVPRCAGVMPAGPLRREGWEGLADHPGNVRGAAFTGRSPLPGLSEAVASGPSPWGALEAQTHGHPSPEQALFPGSPHPHRGAKDLGFLRRCLSEGRLLCQREGESTRVLSCPRSPRPSHTC